MAGGCGLAAGWPGRCQGGRPEILSYFFIEQSVETRGRTLRGHERLENAHVDARSRRLLPPTQQPPGYQQMDAVTNGSLATNACHSERKGEQPPFPPAGPATLNRSFRAHRKAQRQRHRERERERETDRWGTWTRPWGRRCHSAHPMYHGFYQGCPFNMGPTPGRIKQTQTRNKSPLSQ